MSRFGPVRCYECGNLLGDKYEIVEYLTSVLNEGDKGFSFNPIFELLNIREEKECCRAKLMTVVRPRDLEVGDTF